MIDDAHPDVLPHNAAYRTARIAPPQTVRPRDKILRSGPLRRTTGTPRADGHWQDMSSVSKIERAANRTTARTQARAMRLRTEARNCLTVAVRQDDTDHAATLIDEAIKLTRRSEELEGT